ncbi:hypothetical protein Hanom_Chr10g00882751 [Helianthus anomalus]
MKRRMRSLTTSKKRSMSLPRVLDWTMKMMKLTCMEDQKVEETDRCKRLIDHSFLVADYAQTVLVVPDALK